MATKITTPELFNLSSNNTAATQLPVFTTSTRPTSGSSGEMIFNSTTEKVEYWDGFQWNIIKDEGQFVLFSVDYLVIAGGGGGLSSVYYGPGGGAGGFRTSYGSVSGGGSSAESALTLATARTYTVTIGAGGSENSLGNDSSILEGATEIIKSLKGGMGTSSAAAGSGAGGSRVSYSRTLGTAGQGYNGGSGAGASGSYGGSGGGGGGAGGSGSNATSNFGGNGGAGLNNSITGSSVGYAGGGAGMYYSSGCYWSGSGLSIGPGTASHGGSSCANSTALANRGGGGHTNSDSSYRPGGSGVIVLRYPSTYTISLGAGLVGSTSTVGSDKVTQITAGTGDISFT